jgi:hypothetical protein
MQKATRTTTNRALACLVALPILLLAGTASAQQVGGKLKLGLEASVFNFNSQTETPEDADEGSTTSVVDFGVASMAGGGAMSGSYVGQPPLGVDIGYGLTDFLLLGGRVAVGFVSLSPEEGDSTSGFLFSLFPHIDYVLMEGESLRPFFGGQLGIQTVSTSNGSEHSALQFGFGLEGGVMIFVTEGLSIDPRLNFLFLTGTSESTVDAGGMSMTAESDRTNIILGILMGLAGWM